MIVPQLPDYWNETRKILRSWFENNAPSLGELYEGALRMVYDENFPGRVRFVSHAVREIRNRLPGVIAGYKSGSSLQYSNRLEEIAKIWQESGLPVDGSLPIKITTEDLPSSTDVPIPIKVYKMISELVRDHIRTRKRPREAAKRMFQAIDPENKKSEETLRPRINHWLNCTEWFVERAHDRGDTDDKMGDNELKEKFEIFEKALFAIIGEFYKTLEEIDAILEKANS
jgi:hypothetical protein